MTDYAIFLDDIKQPPRDGRNWVVARSLNELGQTLEERGAPSHISFDADMGMDEPSGIVIAKMIVRTHKGNGRGELPEFKLPEHFTFSAHTGNPKLRPAITEIMEQVGTAIEVPFA